MKRNRLISLLLALAICIGVLSGITMPAQAATSADDVNYVVTNDGYIYNWGTQGELATFLSPNAQTYYQENDITYASLAALTGGTGQSDAPNSALYKALQTLMTDTHTSYTNYEDTKPLYAYTDTQNNLLGKVYCVYCVGEMSSTWNSGSIWQREHTWPKSKSLNGNSAFEQYGYNDETDIMMLRVCCADENMSRSNTAYGKSSGYYYPNLTSRDVRGDVARTMLYGYVRWGNTSYMWGSSGVIESMDVLLEWMAADPVDTWEMGRNDSVEAINGNRNVFVDYPELAFLMFGQSIPQGMATPSGSSDCDHEDSMAVAAKPATCTAAGNTAGRYCNDCYIYFGGYSVIPQLEHNWVTASCTGGKVCTLCGEQIAGSNLEMVAYPSAGTAYKLGIDKKDGVIRYFNGTTESSSVSYRLGATTDITQAVDVYLESVTGGYLMYFMNGSTKTYIRYYHYSGTTAGRGTGRVALTTTAPSEILTYNISAKTMVYKYSSSNSYYMGTYSTYETFSVSNTSYITGSNASNIDVSQYPARFYQVIAGGSHSYQLTDNGDGTHSEKCVACGDVQSTEAHSYEAVSAGNTAATCQCGKEVFAWAGMAVSLESSLQASFVVQTSTLPESGYYAVIEKEVYDKTTGAISIETTRFEASDFVNYNTSGTMKKIVFSGVAAKQMTDRFTVTIYNADGEQISASYTRTIEEYILGLLNTASTKAAMKVVCVDFLNYGAAAQDKFGYRTTELANRGLTDDMKALATADSAVADVTDDRTKGALLAGTAVSAEYEIIPAFVYQTSKLTNVTKAQVSYVNFKGETVSYEVTATDFANYNDAGTMKKIEITGTAVADGASPITVKLIDGNGNVVDETIECVNYYCARMASDHAVFGQLLKVICSAKVAFA